MSILHRSRVALTSAILPDLSGLDREDFWRRFDLAAPLHLRVGLHAAGFGVASVLPRLMGHLGWLGSLSLDAQDAVLNRAAALPGFRDLLEVGKIVACFAYFDEASVQAAVRGRP